eukprot:6172242-Pleurochrysis_carterae.AAC.4
MAITVRRICTTEHVTNSVFRDAFATAGCCDAGTRLDGRHRGFPVALACRVLNREFPVTVPVSLFSDIKRQCTVGIAMQFGQCVVVVEKNKERKTKDANTQSRAGGPKDCECGKAVQYSNRVLVIVVPRRVPGVPLVVAAGPGA